MAVNKVVYGTTVLVDLTQDTVTADKLVQGYTAHDRSGALITGTASGGGGDSYTLTTVVPQQNFTAQDLGGTYQALLTYTAGIEDGEGYLITFDGEEYLCDCYLQWGSDYVAGDIALLWQTTGYLGGKLPFALDYIPSANEFSIGVDDLNQHTVKVEHLEFVDGPLNLITKSITSNGTYSASSDNADGYSSVTVNVPSGGSNDFIVTLAKNSQTDEWEPDCTYAEAAAAASAGKSIVVDADVPSVDATADGEWNDFLQYLEYWVYQYYDSANGGIVETQYRLTANGLIVQGTTTYVVEPTGSMTITQNGTGIDVAQYASVDVAVPTGGTYQAKTNINPTTSSQTITPDSGYDALSSVQINAMPTGTAGTPSATKGSVSNHSVYVTPSVTNTTGYITGGTKTGTAVTVSASELVSGNKAITQNGNNIDVAEYATVSVNVSGSSMNVQTVQSTTRVANTAYTKAASLTCSKSGTYDVYWDCFRSSTSGTSGSQLYIGGSAYGTANTTFSSNIHAQSNHLTNVQINANQEVAVYVRSRATNYYAYCGQLTIVQTA